MVYTFGVSVISAYRGVDRLEFGLVENYHLGLLYRVKLAAMDGERSTAGGVALQRTNIQHHWVCGERSGQVRSGQHRRCSSSGGDGYLAPPCL